MTLECACCGRRMEPGEAIRATPVNGAPVFYVHRPAVASTCIRWAGRATECRITLADPEAARVWDLAAGGQAGHNQSEAPKKWTPRARAVWGRDI